MAGKKVAIKNKIVQTHIGLYPSQIKELKRICKEIDSQYSALIRLAIDHFIATHKELQVIHGIPSAIGVI